MNPLHRNFCIASYVWLTQTPVAEATALFGRYARPDRTPALQNDGMDVGCFAHVLFDLAWDIRAPDAYGVIQQMPDRALILAATGDELVHAFAIDGAAIFCTADGLHINSPIICCFTPPITEVEHHARQFEVASL